MAAARSSLGSAMVLINQESLREPAANDCSEAMTRLERARARWHHFERKDKPAFVRWRAREFGALLSTAREVETQIRDLQDLVNEVEMEMRRGFLDAFRAYQRVRERRRKGESPKSEHPRKTSGSTSAETRRLSDFEKEALFQEWVKRSLGTHPDKMDDKAYAASFEAFKLHMFRAIPEEPLPPKQRSSAAASASEEAPVETAVDARVKLLYRRLVRRLHPDLRADGSATVSALWHEVQEAYAAGDVPRLEILLALCDIEARRLRHQSLSQMRGLVRELQRSVSALEKSLREAEGDDAWNFAQLGPTAELRLRVERELKSNLAHRTRRLELLKGIVAEWAAGPKANDVRIFVA
jgi:hypothetical protein